MGKKWSWLLYAATALILGTSQPAAALETEIPVVLIHGVSAATESTLPLATLGLTIQRRAADGWFDQDANYLSETFSILETSLEPQFTLNFSRIRLSLALPLISRTLNLDSGTTSSSNTPSSDVTGSGVGDARLGLYVLAITGALELIPYLLWKPPTGNDDLMVPDLTAGEKGGTFPLGTGSHEIDLGYALRYRFGFHADISGWMALRWRQKHDPLWIQQGSAVAWNGSSQIRDPLWLAGLLGRFWFHPDYPALECTAPWRHPIRSNSTNLLEAKLALLLQHKDVQLRIHVETPIYGRFFPEPFPSLLMERQASLGIAAGGEFLVNF